MRFLFAAMALLLALPALSLFGLNPPESQPATSQTSEPKGAAPAAAPGRTPLTAPARLPTMPARVERAVPTTLPARLPRDAAPGQWSGLTGSAHDFFGPDAPIEIRCAPCHAQPAPSTQPHTWDPDASRRRRPMHARSDHEFDASSRLCLSCHDGILAGDIVGGGSDEDLFAAGALVDRRRDHPVGIVYPPRGNTDSRFRREFEPIAKLAAEGLVRLPQGRVECISCHDPHNLLGLPGMLVKSNRRSALCLTCHRK